MKARDNLIHTFSDLGMAAKCILLMVFLSFSSMLLAFFAFSELHDHHLGIAALLIILAIITPTSCAIYIARDLANSIVRVTITNQGIRCDHLKENIKILAWEDVRFISKTRYVYGTTTGPHIREYCVFSAHELSEKEKQAILFSASGCNDVAVIPYRRKILEGVRRRFKNCYCHASVDVPFLLD